MATKRKGTARSSVKSPKKTIQETTKPLFPESESPIRAIVCLKKIDDMKCFEETEDCFILGFDPDETVVKSKISLDKNYSLSDDVSIIYEKGQV
ncbi:hypothetical protein Lalb_Chr23g0271961 [Lupinus albus]|uniref:Uncharacterized protein n=1 Tax=Lupinus albus TaxID=3870 RepID=A0A6A4NKV0_LUPAL|nr:hypothetical protein Lalb_Chr23g0271961 [Lupinus albus]